MVDKKIISSPISNVIGDGLVSSPMSDSGFLLGNFMRLLFEAATFRISDNELEAQLYGYSTPTVTHSDAIYSPDADGVYQKYPANEPVFSGARVVLDGGAGTDVDISYATDATGALLSPAPKMVSVKETFTNEIINSRDLTGWTGIINCTGTTTLTGTGITGVANSATVFDVTVAGGGKYYGKSSSTLTILNSDYVVGVAFVKKESSGYANIQILFDTSVTQRYAIYVDLTSGEVTEEYTYPDDYGYLVEDINDEWWKVYLTATDKWSSTTAIIRVFSRFSNTTALNPVIGETTYDAVHLFHNKTIEDVIDLPPIFTTTAPVTLNPTVYSYPEPNHPLNGGYTATIDYSGDDTDILSLGGVPFLYASDHPVELVTDGTFDVAGTENLWTTGANNAVASLVANQLLITPGAGLNYGSVCYEFTAEIGETYTLDFEVASATAYPCSIGVGTAKVGLADRDNLDESIAVAGNKTYDFTATATTLYINPKTSSTVDATLTIDNVSLKKSGKYLSLVDQTNTATSDEITAGEHDISCDFNPNTSLMSLTLDGTKSVDTAFTGTFGSGALTVHETLRDLKATSKTGLRELRKYLNFDGTIYAELTDAVTFAGDYEIETEFVPNDLTTWQIIWGNNSNTSFYIAVDPVNDTLKVKDNNIEIVGTTTLVVGQKYKAKVTRVGTLVSLYIDGVLNGSGAAVVISQTADIIGGYNGAILLFIGQISSVKFTDSVTPANNQEIIFDSGSIQYELAEEGSLGGDAVVNGDFSDGDTGWVLDASFNTVGGVLNSTGGVDKLAKTGDIGLVENGVYIVGWEVVSRVSGSVGLRLGDKFTPTSWEAAPAVNNEIAVCGANADYFGLNVYSSVFEGSVDNFSVKKLTKAAILYNVAADDWTEGVV